MTLTDMPVDFGPLLNPIKEPPPVWLRVIDWASIGLPILAGAFAVVAGHEALAGATTSAAWWSIVSGVLSALGVCFTGWASRIRDRRLAVTHSLVCLAHNIIDRHNRAGPVSP